MGTWEWNGRLDQSIGGLVGWLVGRSVDRSIGRWVDFWCWIGGGGIKECEGKPASGRFAALLSPSSRRRTKPSLLAARPQHRAQERHVVCVMQDAAPFVRCLGWGDWSIHSLIRSTQWLAWAWAWGRVALEVGASSGVLSAPASRGITEQTTRCVCVHMFVPHPTSGSIHTPHPNQPASQGAANHHQQQQPPLWSCRRRRASSDATVCTHAHSACCLSPPSNRSC